MDDVSERVYEYLCCYLNVWVDPPTPGEIAKELKLAPSQVLQALANLNGAGRLSPKSSIPRAYLMVFRPNVTAGGGEIPEPCFHQGYLKSTSYSLTLVEITGGQ